MAAACRDVEAATLAHDGSPPITRITLPTCRAHYPGGSSGCSCRLLPRSRGLPQMAGGSASALSLSRPAQALLALRPAGSLSRPQATFVTRLQPLQLAARAARQPPDQSTTNGMDRPCPRWGKIAVPNHCEARKGHPMTNNAKTEIVATIGIDLGKNTFH